MAAVLARPFTLLNTILLALFISGTSLAQAQHRIVQTNGSERVGIIQEVSNGNISIKVDAGTIGIPMRTVASVQMPAPPQIEQAQQAYLSGNPSQALQIISPITDKFAGLPTEWARGAVQLQAEAALAAEDIASAKQGFEALSQLYGDEAGAKIGLIRVDIEEGRLDEAEKALEPMVTIALEDPKPDSIKGIRYGQVMLANGILKEKQEQYPEALENYLRVVAVFDSDPATQAIAEGKAESLREAHDVVVP